MENAVPYCGDLHLDAGTRKLILNLLSSIRSVIPAAEPPGSGRPDGEPDPKSLDYIHSILVLARKHSRELEGIFDPDELLRYSRYASGYQDIIMLMEKILEEMKTCRDSALSFAGQMAKLVEEHLRMTTSAEIGKGNIRENESLPVAREGVKLKIV